MLTRVLQLTGDDVFITQGLHSCLIRVVALLAILALLQMSKVQYIHPGLPAAV